jgi:integrase
MNWVMPMAPRVLHKLNATRVRALKAAGLHEDGGGLRLVISDTGAKRWVMRISVRGKRHQLGLGGYPAVSLERAREKAAEIRRQAAEGRDIVGERRRRTEGVSFRQAFEAFFENKRKSISNAKNVVQWQSTMEMYVFPFIGDRPVAEIQSDEVLKVFAPIWFDKPDTARRLLQRVEAVFKSAILRGHRERASPCIGVTQELGTRAHRPTNYRFLPYQEVPEFVTRLRASGSQPSTRLAFEWLILTAARSGEVRLAQWKEIDEQARLWTIPADRMKARRPHVVPLPSRCLGILHEIREVYPDSGLVFPGSRTGKPLSDMTLTKVLRDMGLAERATVHGFRSSFKVWCAEVAKVRDEVSEAALAHAIPEKVRADYLRTDFLEERRELMARWAGYAGARMHHGGSQNLPLSAGKPTIRPSSHKVSV